MMRVVIPVEETRQRTNSPSPLAGEVAPALATFVPPCTAGWGEGEA